MASSSDPSRKSSIKSVSVCENRQERILASAVKRVRVRAAQRVAVADGPLLARPKAGWVSGSLTANNAAGADRGGAARGARPYTWEICARIWAAVTTLSRVQL